MDWADYKALADTPGIFSRWMLEQTLELVIAAQPLGQVHEAACSEPSTDARRQQLWLPPLQQQLQQTLAGPILPKPSDHKGVAATDMLVLDLAPQLADVVLALVQQAQVQGQTTSGTRQRGLGGFVAAWREYRESLEGPARDGYDDSLALPINNARSGGVMTQQASAIVLELLDGFNTIDLDRITECFTDDAVYHNMPMDPVTGKDNIRASLEPFLAGSSAVQWDLVCLAENSAGQVLTERVDRFKINDQWIAVDVMGTFEVRDGKIAAWRDYFDLAQFQAQMAKAAGG